MTGTPILSLNNVSAGYGRRVVLPGVNLTLLRGSFVALLGANGSGKSTLIKTILGIIPPLEGKVEFAPIGGRVPTLGYTPQRDTLDSIYLLTSFEVALMGVCGRVAPLHRIGRQERAFVQDCLRQTGADHLAQKLFSELSGGQKQRVLMARALAAKPDFMLLDEPTSGIDASARQALMEVLKRIHQDRQLTILLASHDLPMVRSYVQEVVWVHEGTLQQGSVAEMLTPAKVEEFLALGVH